MTASAWRYAVVLAVVPVAVPATLLWVHLHAPEETGRTDVAASPKHAPPCDPRAPAAKCLCAKPGAAPCPRRPEA